MDENKDKVEKEAKDKEDVSVDTKDIVEMAVNKIVDALTKAKDVTTEPKKEVDEFVRTKIFSDGNLKEITYPTDVKSLTKDEKIVTFFKALLYANKDGASAQVMKALVEGTDAQGGYLVPEELKAEVWRVLPDYAVMRRVARVIPMQTDTLKLNSLSARPYAYWTAEYASKSTTSAEFSQVTLTPNDLVCLLPVSEQLLADANISMVQFIVQLFAEAIATEEDKAFFTGSGTGQPRGINQETLTSVDAGLALSFDHIISVIHSLPQAIRRGRSTAFVAHNNVIRTLRQIKDSQNRYIYEPGNPNSSQEPDRLYGYPIYEQNDIDDSHIYFGDWSYYIIGDRQQMTVATTTEGGEAWRRNAVEIKAVSRVDGRAVITSPFAKITNAL
jgi:HK97 family phage major capsid protein